MDARSDACIVAMDLDVADQCQYWLEGVMLVSIATVFSTLMDDKQDPEIFRCDISYPIIKLPIFWRLIDLLTESLRPIDSLIDWLSKKIQIF